MKNLELNQMESLNGGDNCDNTSSVIYGVTSAGWAVGALLVTTPLGLGLFVVGAAGVIAGGLYCEGSLDLG